MPHRLLLQHGLDKLAAVVGPGVGFVAAQAGTSDLPGWLNGTIAGGVIVALLYLVRYVVGLWQAKDAALNEAKDRRIAELTEELEATRNEVAGLRNELHQQRQGGGL